MAKLKHIGFISKTEFFAAFANDLPGNSCDSSGIYFEHLSMDGLQEMHRYSSDPRLYEFFEYDTFLDIAETKAYITKLLNRMSGELESRNAVYWFVRRCSDDFLIGTACLVNLDYPRKSVEWGYGVDPALWGNGYVLKVQEALKKFVFGKLRLNRLHGITMIHNHRTIESVLASGLVHEGISRDHYCCSNDLYVDGWQYSIIAKDYFDQKSSSKVSGDSEITSQKIISVISSILPQESINTESSMKNTSGWDSLTHMNLMIELKEEFGIDFSPSDIAKADSVKAIVALTNTLWKT